jgi:hypothetical protein
MTGSQMLEHSGVFFHRQQPILPSGQQILIVGDVRAI